MSPLLMGDINNGLIRSKSDKTKNYESCFHQYFSFEKENKFWSVQKDFFSQLNKSKQILHNIGEENW